MAELHVMGPYQGPNEKKTAEYLASNLPKDWHVVANRKLPDANNSDVDLWILSPTKLFVIEEKSWGPSLVLGDQRWEIIKKNGTSRESANPLNSVSIKAKIAAGWLRDQIEEYKQVKGLQVLAGVILSHHELIWKVRKGYTLPDSVMALDESVELLTSQASQNQDPIFVQIFSKILATLLDYASPEDQLSRIENFDIRTELEGEPGLRIFKAEHSLLGDEVILKCYLNSYWDSSSSGAEPELEREVKALSKVKTLNRTWQYYLPFQFPLKDWTIVPLLKPIAVRSFGEYFQLAESKPELLAALLKNELVIASDAFRAISELHALGVLHKAITPNRIWLGKAYRVVFSDFYLAHVDGLETVVDLKEDPSSLPHRPKETLAALDFATTKSDVYGVGLVLARFHTQLYFHDVEAVCLALGSEGSSYCKLLLRALADAPSERPEAIELVSELEKLLNPKGFEESVPEDRSTTPENEQPDDSWESGNMVLNKRFELLEKLGSGGVGVTWKAIDSLDDRVKVLKKLHSQSLRLHAEQEVANAQGIDHVGCAKVYEMVSNTAVLSEFIEGVTLKEKSSSPNFTPKNIRELTAQLLQILSYLHGRNLVHGDLNPKNVIIAEDWSPKLIDFGLLTKVGDIQAGGTRATLAPETASGKGVVPQSDLYSFSAGMIMLMLNRAPYSGDTQQVTDRDFSLVPLTEFEKEQWGDEGVALLEVFFRACSPNIIERPESAEAMVLLLQEAKPLPVEKITPGGSNVRQVRNGNVGELRSLYVRSVAGSRNSLGIATEFSKKTYSPTLLDTKLVPDVLASTLSLVVLTGNPGDGKTSFLEMLEMELREKNAEVQSKDSSGWTIKYGTQTFIAVLDASEATSDKSSDDSVNEALQLALKPGFTALIAVNDGRLKEFFEINAFEYPDFALAVENFFEGKESNLSSVAIVDLKTRNIVSPVIGGLADRIVSQLVDEELWNECHSCISQGVCPIYQNRNTLRGSAKNKVLELIEISHLKRRKRSTLRQIRSTLAWLITADLSCDDVHASSIDLTASGKYSLQELAFSPETEDPLVQEWREADPALKLDVKVDKLVRRRPKTEDEVFSGHDRYSREMRNLYFENNPESPVLYKFLKDYRLALKEPNSPELKDRILRGISSLLGAVGYMGSDLLITQSRQGSAWAVARKLKHSEFVLSTPEYDGRYLEVSGDYLQVKHQSGVSLNLNLDSAELIFRASNGEIVGDRMSESIRFEIDNFTKRLLRAKTTELFIVQPNGQYAEVAEKDGVIELVESGYEGGL